MELVQVAAGGSSCTDLFDLDHSAISFRGTRNAVAMNWMSVDRRRFLRGVPGAALLARGTGRTETGMGAHLSVAYEDVGRQIASDFIGFNSRIRDPCRRQDASGASRLTRPSGQ
jgi:hypothetical protein